MRYAWQPAARNLVLHPGDIFTWSEKSCHKNWGDESMAGDLMHLRGGKVHSFGVCEAL
jgi:hypothetical protein